jgi:hypothetical protein
MSKVNAHGFVVQEVLYSPDLRRICSICGAKRKIGNLNSGTQRPERVRERESLPLGTNQDKLRRRTTKRTI